MYYIFTKILLGNKNEIRLFIIMNNMIQLILKYLNSLLTYLNKNYHLLFSYNDSYILYNKILVSCNFRKDVNKTFIISSISRFIFTISLSKSYWEYNVK